MLLRYTAYDLNNSLNVAAKIFDMTTGTPELLATLAMPSVGVNGGYLLSYQPASGHLYYVNMMVYTDGTFETPNSNYTPGDAQMVGPSASACETAVNIFGLINNPINVVGFVNCDCD